MNPLDKLIPLFRFCRNILGITQEQLAEKIGISAKAWSKIETGKNSLDITHLKSICDALHQDYLAIILLAFQPNLELPNPALIVDDPHYTHYFYPDENLQKALHTVLDEILPKHGITRPQIQLDEQTIQQYKLEDARTRARIQSILWRGKDTITIQELFENKFGIYLK